jgi:hypothetical protein
VNLAETLLGYLEQQQKFRLTPVSGRAIPANEEKCIMSDDIKLAAPRPDQDDGFNPITPTDRVIIGTHLKFTDGVWSENEIKVPAGTRFLALSTHKVLERWQNYRVIQTIWEKPLQPLPDVKELNSKIPQNTWDLDRNGDPRAPWQLTFVVYLLAPTTCEKFTFANSTVGARIGTETLQDCVAWMRRLRGANVVPEVELCSKTFPTKHGRKPRPEFKIVDWHLLGKGGDANTAALPGGHSGNGGEQPALPGLTSVQPPSLKEELNDSIDV